jgi:26S proteasome regulatory subunit N7
MAPFYQLLCDDLKTKPDTALLETIQAENTQAIEKLDAKIKDAEENLGETEISDFLLEKADYLASIGHKVDFRFQIQE